MKNISNETLNAYVDGELDENERYQVTDALINNPELKSRLDNIARTRKLYAAAFASPPAADTCSTAIGMNNKSGKRLLARSLAASLLVVISFIAGSQWSINYSDSDSDNGNRISTFSTFDTLEQLSSQKGNPATGYKALVHIEKFDKNKALDTLARIDNALATARANNINAKIEIVMQGKSLGLIRTDTSPVASEIKQLLAKHNNLVIAACNKTLERLKLEKGIEAELLPDVLVVPSALDQILNRLQHDWLYIKV